VEDKETVIGNFKKIQAVTFLGYADAEKGTPLYDEARETARLVAERGITVVNGGGPGVMMAATEGAHDGGGKAYVATFRPKYMENFEGRDPRNEADKEIVMNNYLERTMKLLELGNAYLIFNGGTGTVSEFGMAWGLARLYFGHHKPLILFGGFWYPIMEAFATNIKIRPEELRVYKIVTTPRQAVEALWWYETQLTEGKMGIKKQVDGESEEAAFINK